MNTFIQQRCITFIKSD